MKAGRMEIHDIAVLFESTPSRPVKGKVEIYSLKMLKSNELELFARTLSGLLEGGVPILKALEGLGMLPEVRENVRCGMSFSEALKKSGRVPAYFYQTVYGGEVSGRVPLVLAELSKYMAKEQSLKRGVREALVYPAFILVTGFVTIAVLMCHVLPKLQKVYEGYDAGLPTLTVLVVALSKVFLPLTLVFAGSAATLAISWKKNGYLTRFFYELPFLGDFFRKSARVRFSRLLSLLLESGVPVLDALNVIEKNFSEDFLRQDIAFVRESLSKGGHFSESLAGIGWMDPLSRMLVASGEETGKLSVSFFQIARDTESDLESRLHLAVKLLEPALVLLVGFGVGFIVMGTVLPIFDISSLVQ